MSGKPDPEKQYRGQLKQFIATLHHPDHGTIKHHVEARSLTEALQEAAAANPSATVDNVELDKDAAQARFDRAVAGNIGRAQRATTEAARRYAEDREHPIRAALRGPRDHWSDVNREQAPGSLRPSDRPKDED